MHEAVGKLVTVMPEMKHNQLFYAVMEGQRWTGTQGQRVTGGGRVMEDGGTERNSDGGGGTDEVMEERR